MIYIYIVRKYDASSGMYEVDGVWDSYASAHDYLLDNGWYWDDWSKLFYKNGSECSIDRRLLMHYNADSVDE